MNPVPHVAETRPVVVSTRLTVSPPDAVAVAVPANRVAVAGSNTSCATAPSGYDTVAASPDLPLAGGRYCVSDEPSAI